MQQKCKWNEREFSSKSKPTLEWSAWHGRWCILPGKNMQVGKMQWPSTRSPRALHESAWNASYIGQCNGRVDGGVTGVARVCPRILGCVKCNGRVLWRATGVVSRRLQHYLVISSATPEWKESHGRCICLSRMVNNKWNGEFWGIEIFFLYQPQMNDKWPNKKVGRWRRANEQVTPHHLTLYIKRNKREEGRFLGSFSLFFAVGFQVFSQASFLLCREVEQEKKESKGKRKGRDTGKGRKNLS